MIYSLWEHCLGTMLSLLLYQERVEHMFQVLTLDNQLLKGVIEQQCQCYILLVQDIELLIEVLLPVSF